MSSTRYEQPELPLVEVTLAEHREKTGHDPLLYQTGAGENVWVCTHRDDINGNCFASWPPPAKHEMFLENATLDVLRTGTFQVGPMTIIYMPDEEAERLQGMIVRGYN